MTHASHLKHPGGPLFTVPYPPPDWFYLQAWGDGHSFSHKRGLSVIVDCELKSDSKKWVHVSVSRKKWTPSHEDMLLVKDAFIGRDRYAYSVYPPSEKYVNIHKYCLHLWASCEGDGRVLPEFSGVLPIVGRTI